jgi:hypothetical protein
MAEGKTATVEIGAGGRNSRSSAAGSIGEARVPVIKN